MILLYQLSLVGDNGGGEYFFFNAQNIYSLTLFPSWNRVKVSFFSGDNVNVVRKK